MNPFHFLLYEIKFLLECDVKYGKTQRLGEQVKGKNFTLCLKKGHSTTDGWQGLFRGNWVPFNFRAMI